MSLSQIELVWVRVRVERVFLSESERRKQGVWIQHGRIQDGWHHQIESEWMSEVFFCANGGNQSWQMSVSLRGKTKIADSKMAEFKMAAIIKLSENEWVWVRVTVEEECFWVNLREDNKVSESKMAVSQSNMAEFKIAALIKLSQNEWVKFFFVQMVGTNLGKCQWVWEEKLRWLIPRWPNSRWSNSKWLPSSS